jgi:RNA polymerase sigma-70 factor (sigma-E family)
MTTRFDGLDALVADHGRALLASATLLAGSREAGEDLLQAALERAMRRWPEIHGQRVIYVRRTLYHLAVDSWRARRRRPRMVDRPIAELEAAGVGVDRSDGLETVQLRQALMQALAQLPPRQRAVLVLRYWEQRSETETAQLLDCSVGTVKSTASRGLTRLREVTRDWADDGVFSGKGSPS